MVFITAGLGGGTGTGATPVIAEICREMGALTVAVVTRPFSFEGKRRAQIAEQGLTELKKYVDTAITIPNDRLRALASKKATLMEMFMKADEILLHAVKGITDLILMPGWSTSTLPMCAMSGRLGLMGIGVSSRKPCARGGENHLASAARDISIAGARCVANITASSSMEFEGGGAQAHPQEVGEDAEVFWGSVDDSLGDEMQVTVSPPASGPGRCGPAAGRTWPKKGHEKGKSSPSPLRAGRTSLRPTWIHRHIISIGRPSCAAGGPSVTSEPLPGVGRMALNDTDLSINLPAPKGGLSAGRHVQRESTAAL
jgi:cell division protein FtsZ